MRHLVSMTLAFTFVTALGANQAHADEELDLTLDPDFATASPVAYEDFKLRELERTAKRSRSLKSS